MANVFTTAKVTANAGLTAVASTAEMVAAASELGAVYVNDYARQVTTELAESAEDRTITRRMDRAQELTEHAETMDKWLAKGDKKREERFRMYLQKFSKNPDAEPKSLKSAAK